MTVQGYAVIAVICLFWCAALAVLEMEDKKRGQR